MDNYAQEVVNRLEMMFPHAKGELNYTNIYELLMAVILSAQATDKRVNIVTPSLFAKYDSFEKLAKADIEDVKVIIKSIGLYSSKANNMVKCAQMVVDEYQGIVPNNMEALLKLPGVGRKTASIILIEGYNIPAFPVDTHVSRTAKRLKLAASNDDVGKIETKLKKKFAKEKWKKLHHQLIFLGRYVCLARKPKCLECQLNDICPKVKVNK